MMIDNDKVQQIALAYHEAGHALVMQILPSERWTLDKVVMNPNHKHFSSRCAVATARHPYNKPLPTTVEDMQDQDCSDIDAEWIGVSAAAGAAAERIYYEKKGKVEITEHEMDHQRDDRIICEAVAQFLCTNPEHTWTMFYCDARNLLLANLKALDNIAELLDREAGATIHNVDILKCINNSKSEA